MMGFLRPEHPTQNYEPGHSLYDGCLASDLGHFAPRPGA